MYTCIYDIYIDLSYVQVSFVPVMEAALRSVLGRRQARGRDVVVVGASDEGEAAVLALLREVGWWEGGGGRLVSVFVRQGSGEVGATGEAGQEGVERLVGEGRVVRVVLERWDTDDDGLGWLLFPGGGAGGRWGVVLVDNLFLRDRAELLRHWLALDRVVADWMLVHDADGLARSLYVCVCVYVYVYVYVGVCACVCVSVCVCVCACV